MQSIPETTTGPSCYMREGHVREALTLLNEKVADYVQRSVFEVEIGMPRDEVDALIVEVSEEVVWTGEHVHALDLALEDLSLAQRRPESFEAVANDDDPPNAEYLILTNYEAWLRQQLQLSVQNHPPCCEICGREPAARFWLPDADIPACGPEHLVGLQRWGIGDACLAVLERGEPLRFIEYDQARTSASLCLIPLEQERPASVLAVAGTVPPASLTLAQQLAHPTLAQRLAELEALFDEWCDEMIMTRSVSMPDLQEVDHAIVRMTLPRLPHQHLDSLQLVLLARQEPELARWQPRHYGMLVEASGEEVTAALVLWCALADYVFSRLRQRWHQRQERRGQ